MDLGTVTLAQFALVAVTGVLTGIVGGIAGYGSGLLLPLVLVPIMGAEAVVPIIAVTAMFTNVTRMIAFREHIDRSKVITIAVAALPTTMLGGWGFTLLTGRGALILIGSMLVVLVPLRWWLQRMRARLYGGGLVAASIVYGIPAGGTSGAGVILLSLLMWAGLQGPAVIATDAAISIALGLAKIGTFQAFGAMPGSYWLMALVIGLCATPGAFIAKRLVRHISLEQHTGILDVVVLLGGLGLIWQGLRV